MSGEPGRHERVRYRFSPLERRGVIAGWRGGQIASVAVSLVLGVLALRSGQSAVGVLIAVLLVAAGVALAFWPVRGRTGEQWLPLVVRWVWEAVTGTRRSLAPGPGRGHVAAVPADGGAAAARVDPPGASPVRGAGPRSVFDGVEIVALDATGAPGAGPDGAGMVLDATARTATAAVSVRGHSFALLSPVDQDARIAAWARVLAGLAREGTEVHRLSWIESCLPDDGSAVRRYWEEHASLGADTRAGRSYRALMEESSPVTRRHQVLVALTVHTSRSARSIKASGGGRRGTGAVLSRELSALHRALSGADVTVDGVLGRSALARVVGEASTPLSGTGPDGARPHPVHWPWPMATEAAWDAVRTDATWHATYWVAEWPRVEVTPDFLGPLLFSPVRRTVTMVMEPVSPTRAARQVAQARTADIADGELRRRGGFLTTARHHREQESVEHRDVELADGHAQFRFTGYVTVTADSRSDLQAAGAAIEQAAGQARLELRLLYGQQDRAFACSLPLGRGLS